MSDVTLVVGGRTFELAHDITFEHHIWMMNHIFQAGLHEPAENAYAQLGKLLACGRIPQVLAGALMEVGVAWTPEAAEKNAEFFRTLSAPADVQTLDAALMTVLANFFPLTGSSLPTSPSSSTSEGENESAPIASAEASTLATGPSSSESSPAGITTASPQS